MEFDLIWVRTKIKSWKKSFFFLNHKEIIGWNKDESLISTRQPCEQLGTLKMPLTLATIDMTKSFSNVF